MTTITRRTALSGLAALPVLAAGGTAVAATGDDAELFAKAERFTRLCEEKGRIETHYKAMRDAVEADPACPENVPPSENRAMYEAWNAFLEERGVWKECDRWNEGNLAVERAVRDLFQTPAQTSAGILIKLRILQTAIGPFSQADGDHHDEDLLCAQWDYSGEDENGDAVKVGEVDFLAAVIADLERMTGRAAA